VFRKVFDESVDLLAKLRFFLLSCFSSDRSNSICRVCKPVSNEDSVGVSNQTIVRSNTDRRLNS
jgi:hypothetical protein